jgi:hypothetical protein
MNVLINPEELVAPLARKIICKQLQPILKIEWTQTNEYVSECKQTHRDTGYIVIDFNRVNYLLKQDLLAFRKIINEEYKAIHRAEAGNMLVDILQSGVSEQDIIEQYLNSNDPGFVKSVAPTLSLDLNWITKADQADHSQPFLIRNIYRNELLLKQCIDEKKEFWFIDSGYTNFLIGKKKIWHRLVHNNIHHNGSQLCPTDRIDMLPSRPKDWRKKGSKILVVESSPSHYLLKGTTLEDWRRQVETELREFTDREIEFRPKEQSRKTRTTVYDLLSNTKEYYCVISDSSAAAIESIWAGTPVVTLGTHITNMVSRHDLSQINNLYRGDIEPWLARLTYSQFTFEELTNGTAVDIVREWHDA